MSKISPILLFLFLAASTAHATIQSESKPSDSDLQKLLPDGYRVDKVLRCKVGEEGGLHFLAVLSDQNQTSPEKPIRLLYIDGKEKWFVIDSLQICGEDAQYPPNYVETMSIETVGDREVIFLYTMAWGGGSGSNHFYQFFTIANGRLQLLKAIEHERMLRFYFCLYNHRIFDMKLVKIRGEKRGKAFVYTCYLEATEYTYDGKNIVPLRTERFREKQGNRFLDEDYRCVSLRNAIIQKEVFSRQP